jgi:hypothetical protein
VIQGRHNRELILVVAEAVGGIPVAGGSVKIYAVPNQGSHPRDSRRLHGDEYQKALRKYARVAA